MPPSHAPEDVCLGFLTAVEVPRQGFVGGLLVTNRFGRPLEFQCTSPVKANRTQEILYGPTLRPYLLGELIGKTLLERVSIKPQLVLTEEVDLLEVRNHLAVPVACVGDNDVQSGSTLETLPEAVRRCRRTLRFHAAHLEDRAPAEQAVQIVPDNVDLAEPFARIREALRETLQTEGVR